MIELIILSFSLIGLYFARYLISERIQGLSLLLTNDKFSGIKIYSLLFLPGIILHELSHFFVAAFLNVRTGKITIFPQEKEDEEIRLGSVGLAKTDVLRSSLIGAAPLFIGSLAIYLIIHLQFPDLINQPNLLAFLNQIIASRYQLAQFSAWMALYAILAVANTMFVSKEDRHSWPLISLCLVLALIVVFLSGKSFWLSKHIFPLIISLAQSLSACFALAIIIDLIAIAGLLIIEKMFETVTRKRIHYH